MEQTLVGLFLTGAQARKVASELESSGVRRGHIEIFGAVVTGIERRLDRAGVPEQDRAVFIEGVRRGGALVLAAVDDGLADRAASIMDDNGAADLDELRSAWAAAPPQKPALEPKAERQDEPPQPPAEPESPPVQAATNEVVFVEPQIVEMREQELGRVHANAMLTPVDQTYPVLEEHVSIERRPANRLATETDFQAFEQGVIELVELAEELVVTKRARVIEEVVVIKKIHQAQQSVHIEQRVTRASEA